jgi:predicted phage-related endonuclease
MGVWQRKLGLGGQVYESAPMRLGNYIEDGIVRWYQDEAKVKTVRSTTRRHPTRKWMLATPDRVVVENGKPSRLVECKSIGPATADLWTKDPDGVPAHVRAQVEWQCEVVGVKTCDVAALFLSSREFRIYRIERNEILIKRLIEIGDIFWHKYVLTETPPPIDGSDAARDYLGLKFPENRVHAMKPAPAEALEIVREYRDAADSEKAAKDRKALARNRACELIGDADGILGRGFRATWKLDAHGDVDWKALALSLGATAAQQELHRGAPIRRFRATLKDEA